MVKNVYGDFGTWKIIKYSDKNHKIFGNEISGNLVWWSNLEYCAFLIFSTSTKEQLKECMVIALRILTLLE